MNTLDDYQVIAAQTASRMDDSPACTVTMALGLTGEAGEAADLVKKWWAQDHELDRNKLRKELGDILWYVAGMATNQGWSLHEIAEENLAKLAARYPNGFESERSIHRTVDG